MQKDFFVISFLGGFYTCMSLVWTQLRFYFFLLAFSEHLCYASQCVRATRLVNIHHVKQEMLSFNFSLGKKTFEDVSLSIVAVICCYSNSHMTVP